MKLLKLLPLIMLVFLTSCDNDRKTESDDMDDMIENANVRKPKEVHNDWIAAWNKNSASALDSLTARDAVLYLEGKSMSADSIRSWYKEVAPMMKGLQAHSEASYSNKDIAYEAGTYKHQIKGDSLNNTYEGTYTFIWKRSNNDWKLQVLNIAEENADTTAVEQQ